MIDLPKSFGQLRLVASKNDKNVLDQQADFDTIDICDPSRKKGAYPNFTLWLFHGPGREIVKNYWNVSEISLSRREKGHSHRENISRRENRS